MNIVVWLIFLIYLLASAFLVLVVLLQSGKGGGLSGLVGAGSSLGDTLGATGAEKTLNRWTTYAAVGFLCLNILLVAVGGQAFNQDELEKIAGDTTAIEQPELPVDEAETPPAEATPEPDSIPTPIPDQPNIPE